MRALLARIERLEAGRPAVQGTSPQRETPAPPSPSGEQPERSTPPAADARPARDDADQDAAPEIEALAPSEEPEQRSDEPSAPPATQAPGAAPALSDEPEQPEPAPAAGDLASVTSLWPAVVELVRSENALLGALIAEAQPVSVDGDDLTLAFAATDTFLKKKAEDPTNRMIFGEALRAVTAKRWRLSYELSEKLAAEASASSPEHSEEDWVKRFMDEFDAEELPGEWEAASEGPEHGVRGVEAMSSNEKGA